MELQQSFRSIAAAIDRAGAEHTEDFLARLVLILAEDINDAKTIETAVERALAACKQEGGRA